MEFYRLLSFLSQWVSIGLALAFLAVLVEPELLPTRRAEVVVQQVPPASPRMSPAGGSGHLPLTFSGALAAARPAVVNIRTEKTVPREQSPLAENPLLRRFADPEVGQPPETLVQNSLGSGVVVSAQGYVLTNYHVIAEAEAIRVTLLDGREAPARLVGSDPDTDLAVLRTEMTGLPPIRFGRSSDLTTGDVVLAIGNPFGFGQTVTMGIVSATGRNRLGVNTFEDFIQTDAAINPGNSGGALVNPQGELVGINTALLSRAGGAEGIGFAIPADLAMGVLRQILEHGQVVRGWLGIRARSLAPDVAASLALDPGQGALVVDVLEDGPGHRAGLVPGDVILQVNGRAVGDVRNLLEDIAQQAPGQEIVLGVWRDGRQQQVQAAVGQRPIRP